MAPECEAMQLKDLRQLALDIVREYGAANGICAGRLGQVLRRNSGAALRAFFGDAKNGNELQHRWLMKLMNGVPEVGCEQRPDSGRDWVYYLKEGISPISSRQMSHYHAYSWWCSWQSWQASCAAAMSQQAAASDDWNKASQLWECNAVRHEDHFLFADSERECDAQKDNEEEDSCANFSIVDANSSVGEENTAPNAVADDDWLLL